MSYFLANTIPYKVLPWFYTDESSGKIYVLSFFKVSQDIEDALYENFYALDDHSDIFSDQEASDFLNIANLTNTVFLSNTVNTLLNVKTFKGSQIGGVNATSLFFLRESAYYQFSANASFDTDGVKGLQFWEILSTEEGFLSIPNKFILDKSLAATPVVDFNYTPLVQVAVGLDNSGLTNSAVVFHYNSNYGYYSNKTLTPTSNVQNTFVTYLPSINLTASNTGDIDAVINIVAKVTYSNNLIYPSAQTKISLDTNLGYLSHKVLSVNSLANVTFTGTSLPVGDIAVIKAGWPNYLNVANVSIGVNTPDFYRYYQIDGVQFAQVISYQVPWFAHTFIVEVWGGGGQGAWNPDAGANGQQSSFVCGNTTITAGGGKGGHANAPGDGGIASGGDINFNGANGYLDIGGASGIQNSANNLVGGGGYWRLLTPVPNPPPFLDDTTIFLDSSPGTGGGGNPIWNNGSFGGGGGGGAYAKKIFTSNTQITIGSTMTLTAGLGGAATQHSQDPIAVGQGGRVKIQWR